MVGGARQHSNNNVSTIIAGVLLGLVVLVLGFMLLSGSPQKRREDKHVVVVEATDNDVTKEGVKEEEVQKEEEEEEEDYSEENPEDGVEATLKPPILSDKKCIVERKGSSARQVYSGIYELKEVCISKNSLIFFGRHPGSLHFLNEYNTAPVPVRVVPDLSKMKDLTFDCRRAFVFPFTHVAGWHLMHGLSGATKAMNMFHVENSKDMVYRYYAFEMWRPQDTPLLNAYHPLLRALGPTRALHKLNETSMECYASIFAGSPAMRTAQETAGLVDSDDVASLVERMRKAFNVTINMEERKQRKKLNVLMTQRKNRHIVNLEELFQLAKKELSDWANVSKVLWEQHSIEEQLRIATDQDILFGNHGNNLFWGLFLQPPSVIVEVNMYGFSTAAGVNVDTHGNYGGFARLRKSNHVAWSQRNASQSFHNDKPERERDTYVPPQVFLKMLEAAREAYFSPIQPAPSVRFPF